MKLVLKIIYNILIVLFAFILVLLVYNFVNLKIFKNHYTNFFGFTIFEIASGSMNPYLVENDLVIVKINDNINVDDVVTYKKGDMYITHRVVEIQGDYLICRGDSNNTNDAPVKKSDVLGKVIRVLPRVGIWKSVFTTPKVFVSVIITIILFELVFTYKVTKKFTDYSISRRTIIEEVGDLNEE